MFSRGLYLICLLFLLCKAAKAEQLQQLTNIDFDQADFYLLDVTDNKVKAFPSVDAYSHQDKLYLAITPLFEGFRVKYSLIGTTLKVTVGETQHEFELSENSSQSGKWFNDGSFIFVQAAVLEELFGSQITLNTSSLKMDFSGHKIEFPYKTIQNQQKQRKLRNYIVDDQEPENQPLSGPLITIKDQYRLATVPNGYASIEYRANDRNETYDLSMQTISDLAYHSANITLVHDDQETSSRVLFSRYPQYTGDKILGIWDQYSFGDLYLRKSNLTPGSSRGLGIEFSANLTDNFTENMTTSFAKTARPGWDADIYHNGVFLETRVVPADGLMEFSNLEVFYGANEFKIVLYGPYGEQETLIERVNVKNNALSRGDLSYGLSLKENDSSLLDIDASEFDIDDIGGYINFGVFNNWQVGLAVNLTDIHNPNGGSETFRLSNQVTLPGWFFQNSFAFSEKIISQQSSLATAFFNNDNLTLRYNSQWQKEPSENNADLSNIDLSYNFNFNSITNNINYSYNDFGNIKNERLNYRLSYFHRYFNLSNTLSYSRRNTTEDRLYGALNLTTSVNRDIRLVANIPYDIKGEESIDPDLISASVLYNYRLENYNHAFSLSNRSFFKDNLWTVGYNLAVNKPTHQMTFRTLYNSEDKWSVSAGITVNFAYDYFNNKMLFSSETLRGAGSIDVHSYLDRQLNGIPDVLDYDLEGVTFSGGHEWDSVETNEEGRARLLGAKNGVTALNAFWNTGSGGKSINNDYLIYSHPGSLQRVNLPFYLTTEVELFVVLTNDAQEITLRNVPLTAKNTSTGDEYTIETDFDGYANFTGLFPGKYQIYINQEFLREKGLQASVGGFEFTSPLRGGFVVLPNIEVSRSESGDIGENQLIMIRLDENNYAPLLNTDNDKLIHLPPKGAIKAPYSSDELDRAVFKAVKTEHTEQQRRALREKLQDAADSSPYKQIREIKLQPQQAIALPQTDEQPKPALVEEKAIKNKSVEPSNEAQALEAKIEDQPNDQQPEVSQALDVKTIQANSTNVIQVDTLPSKLSTGFVVQYSALNDLNTAKQMSQNYQHISQLSIAKKMLNGVAKYCLISQVFAQEQAARNYIKDVEKNGFVVNSSQYIERVWSR